MWKIASRVCAALCLVSLSGVILTDAWSLHILGAAGWAFLTVECAARGMK